MPLACEAVTLAAAAVCRINLAKAVNLPRVHRAPGNLIRGVPLRLVTHEGEAPT